MAYGILASNSNSGLDSELQCVFATPLVIKSNQPAYVQDALNLKRRAASQNVQRWEIEAKLSPTNNRANFLTHSVMNGYSTVIYVRMPQPYGIAVSSSDLFDVANGVAAGSSEFQTLYNHAQGRLKVGEFIRFAGHSKVYLVVKVGPWQGSGADAATVFPPLVKDIVGNEVIFVDKKVTMYAHYESDTQLGITYVDGILSDPGSIKLIEAL